MGAITNVVSTAATNDLQLKWKKNADVTAPLMEYMVKELGEPTIVVIRFRPHKMKQWEIVVTGASPVYFEGTRADTKKMQLCAEAMVEQWKEVAP